MKKIFKYSWIFLRSILIFLALWAIMNSSVKNIESTIKIEQFKAQGIYEPEKSSSFIKYYRVPSNNSDEPSSYHTEGNIILPGNTGDIIVSLNSSLKIPLIKDIISFYAGGHAAICCDDYYDYIARSNKSSIIEAPGVDDYPCPARISNAYYWSTPNLFNPSLVLRVKMTEREKKEMLSYAQTLVGDPYNYSFLFDTTNKKYCSDLVSKSFKKINKNLNKDSFATTIQDLVISDETYISFYQYFENDVRYIYYLG